MWQVACDRWSVVDGVWYIGEKRQVECGRWSVVGGMWEVECGRWSVVGRMREVECGRWNVVGGMSVVYRSAVKVACNRNGKVVVIRSASSCEIPLSTASSE